MDNVNDNSEPPSGPRTPGEAFYDDEIAPVLEKLSLICEAHGMGFVASVEFAPGAMATTANVAAQSSMNGLLALWGSRAAGNVDKLAMTAAAHVKANGLPHSSAVLEALGVPMEPEA
jgi:hypothetical protein